MFLVRQSSSRYSPSRSTCAGRTLPSTLRSKWRLLHNQHFRPPNRNTGDLCGNDVHFRLPCCHHDAPLQRLRRKKPRNLCRRPYRGRRQRDLFTEHLSITPTPLTGTTVFHQAPTSRTDSIRPMVDRSGRHNNLHCGSRPVHPGSNYILGFQHHLRDRQCVRLCRDQYRSSERIL